MPRARSSSNCLQPAGGATRPWVSPFCVVRVSRPATAPKRGCAPHFRPSIQRVAVAARDPYDDVTLRRSRTGRSPHPAQHKKPHMLRGLRTASTGWLGKTIMAIVVGVLVIAFAAWGIGD